MSHLAAEDTTEYKKSKDIIYYVHSAIFLIIMFFFGDIVPPFGSITPLGMDILGVFLGLLYGWVFVDLLWPSLISMVALGMSDYTTVKAAFLNGFGNDMTLMIFFFLAFAAYLDMVGLTEIIANWFISRKIVKGKPWVFVCMIFLAAYVLGATVSLFATIVIIWSIFYKICNMVGYKQGEKTPSFIVLGIAQATILGFCIFPFKPFGLLIIGILEKTSGQVVGFGAFTLFTVIVSFLALVAYVLMGKYLLGVDVSLLAKADNATLAGSSKVKLNKDQKIATVFFVIFLLMMFLPSILPQGTAIAKWFNDLGILGAIAVVLTLLCMVQIKNKRIVSFDNLVRRGVSWEIVILMAATMPVGVALEAPETGVIDTLVMIMGPMLSQLSPFMFIALCVIILGITTQFAHNLVLAVVFTPILCRMAMEVGANPAVLAIIFVVSLQMALVTPGSSTHGAMVHANVWVANKYAYLFGFVAVVVADLIAIFVGIPLGNMLF